MKFFSKKLLDDEIFSSLVLWPTKYFLKNLQNPPPPPSYLLNVHSLKSPTTDPPTTYHLPTDAPSTYPPTYVKIEDQILNMFRIL